MTGFTVQLDVVGDRLGSGDLCVTGRARSRNLRRRGIVGVVTADTWLRWIVQPLEDLWEAGGTRGQVLVAGKAGRAAISFDDRKQAFVVLSMCARRAVADLTSESAMIGGTLDLALLIVTFDTDQRTGVPDRLVLNRDEGIRSVVPYLAERLGDETVPDHDQRDNGGDQQDPEPNNLIRELPDSQ